jgi:hypothetical protein
MATNVQPPGKLERFGREIGFERNRQEGFREA